MNTETHLYGESIFLDTLQFMASLPDDQVQVRVYVSDAGYSPVIVSVEGSGRDCIGVRTARSNTPKHWRSLDRLAGFLHVAGCHRFQVVNCSVSAIFNDSDGEAL